MLLEGEGGAGADIVQEGNGSVLSIDGDIVMLFGGVWCVPDPSQHLEGETARVEGGFSRTAAQKVLMAVALIAPTSKASSHVGRAGGESRGFLGGHPSAVGCPCNKTIHTLVSHCSMHPFVVEKIHHPRVLPAGGTLRVLMDEVSPSRELHLVNCDHEMTVSDAFRHFLLDDIRAQPGKAQRCVKPGKGGVHGGDPITQVGLRG